MRRQRAQREVPQRSPTGPKGRGFGLRAANIHKRIEIMRKTSTIVRASATGLVLLLFGIACQRTETKEIKLNLEKTRSQASAAIRKMKHGAKEMAEGARQGVHAVGTTVQETAAQVGEQVQEGLQRASESIQQGAAKAQSAVDQGVKKVKKGATAVNATVEKVTKSVPSDDSGKPPRP